MSSEIERKYLLSIKRNNNDYLPLEWNLTSLYQGENVYSLEGIDDFTKRITKLDFVSELLKENIVDSNDPFRSFAIIYFEKGRYRELKEGPVFLDDQQPFKEDELILYIFNNKDNKNALSIIYNFCNNIKIENTKLEEFKFIIKNIDIFISKGSKYTYAALTTFKNIPYEIKRSILIKATKKSKTANIKKDNRLSYRKNNIENDGKVA